MNELKFYIGLKTKNNTYLSKDEVIETFQVVYKDFTVIEATGYHKGNPEPSLIFVVYTKDTIKDIYLIVEQLSKVLEQECILVVENGKPQLI